MNTTNEQLIELIEGADEHLTNIDQSAPSLSSSAMLCFVSIGVWEGRKKDKKASEEVTTQKNAKRGTASVHKSLMGDNEELQAIKQWRGHCRNEIYYHFTQPWSDSGIRFLTSTAYFHFHPAITAAQAEFFRLVDVFLDNYSYEVAAAQADLGDLFDPTEYPTKEELRGKFKFSIEYMPLPESGDFRVDVSNEQAEYLKSEYSKFYEEQFKRSMQDIWNRLMQPLANMVDKLDYGDGGTKKRFNNTLVDNVLQIVELMGIVNVTNDREMEKVQRNLEDALRGVTPEGLREDSGLRAQVHRVASDALRDTKKAIDELPSIW